MNEGTPDGRPEQGTHGHQSETAALAEAIHTWIENRDADRLRDVLEEHHEFDVARALAQLPPDTAVETLNLLGVDVRASLFGYLPPAFQVELSRRLSRRNLAAIVSAMSHDERADLFKHLDESEQENLLPALAQAER